MMSEQNTATQTSNSTQPNKRLSGRVALITGASRGIGAAVAKAYAKEGAHVILLARTVGSLEQVDDDIQSFGGTATLLPFDLMENKKIEAIGPTIAERFKRLDILVGNAGVLGALSPVALSESRSFKETFKINFFANYHLIRGLDPLLRGSDAGRAIFVSSGAAQSKSPYWSAYAASKAALDVMVTAYAKEVSHSPLKVNLIDPGPIATEMRHEAFPAEDPLTIPSPEDIAEKFIDMALPSFTDTGTLIKFQTKK